MGWQIIAGLHPALDVNLLVPIYAIRGTIYESKVSCLGTQCCRAHRTVPRIFLSAGANFAYMYLHRGLPYTDFGPILSYMKQPSKIKHWWGQLPPMLPAALPSRYIQPWLNPGLLDPELVQHTNRYVTAPTVEHTQA